MLVLIQSDDRELLVVLCNQNLIVGLALQQVLENLQLDELTLKVVHRRSEAILDILEHLIEVQRYRQLDECILLVSEYEAVTLILNVLGQVVSLVYKQFKLIKAESSVAL